MRRLLAILTTAALAAALSAGGVAASNHVTTLSTTLTGSEEVGGADPNGKGWVSLEIFSNGTICYEGKVQAIGRNLTGAHIHAAVAGVNGPVVVDLDPFNADITGNKAEHCVVTSVSLAAAIVATPSAYYVNVHTTTYPGGAIRGQLGD